MIDAVDPEGLQRVQVNVSSVTGAAAVWALTMVTLGPRAEVGDTVLVGFEEGLADQPIVVGVLATATPVAVELADEHGNIIRLSPSGIEVTSPAKVEVAASFVKVSAGSVDVNAPMSQFSGVVKTTTMIADSVVAASYTPGAGNVW